MQLAHIPIDSCTTALARGGEQTLLEADFEVVGRRVPAGQRGAIWAHWHQAFGFILAASVALQADAQWTARPPQQQKSGTALQFSVQVPLACGHMSSQPRPTAGTLSAGRKSLKTVGKMAQKGPQLDGFRPAALLLTAAATAAASAVAATYWWRCCQREAASQEAKRQAGALHSLTRFVSHWGSQKAACCPVRWQGSWFTLPPPPLSLAVCPAQNEASREPQSPPSVSSVPEATDRFPPACSGGGGGDDRTGRGPAVAVAPRFLRRRSRTGRGGAGRRQRRGASRGAPRPCCRIYNCLGCACPCLATAHNAV